MRGFLVVSDWKMILVVVLLPQGAGHLEPFGMWFAQRLTGWQFSQPFQRGLQVHRYGQSTETALEMSTGS